ncbi:hypothetical protein PF003_g6917 [Phytophthora fragariae]|nr:hypothetical protein PF003_g6917 [Phytophthora fragariae]
MLSRRRLTSTDVEAKRRRIDVRTLDVDSSSSEVTRDIEGAPRSRPQQQQ